MYSTLISSQELAKHIDDSNVIIFDCHHELANTSAGREAYAKSHIKGAVYLHLDEDLSGPIIPGETGRHPLPDVDVMIERFSDWGIDESKQVVVYDAKRGAIASRLWWMLRYAGHENVAVLDGGYQAWLQASFPTESIVNHPVKSVFTPKIQSEWVMGIEDIKAAQKDKSWTIIDSRAAERYRGEIEPIDPIAGHIKGAISRPFAENWTTDGMMKSPEELRQRFADLSTIDQCVFYCGSGVTACHNILAVAHAGMEMPRLYPGSWSEWIIDK